MTSQPLVPTGQDYGDRQATVQQMRVTNLPTDLPAEPGPGGAAPTPTPQGAPPDPAFDVFAGRQPSRPMFTEPAPASGIDAIQAKAEASGNDFVLGVLRRLGR